MANSNMPPFSMNVYSAYWPVKMSAQVDGVSGEGVDWDKGAGAVRGPGVSDCAHLKGGGFGCPTCVGERLPSPACGRGALLSR